MMKNQNYTVSNEVLSQEIAGESVLLDLQGENYFGLDSVATRMWQLIQEHQSTEQVFEKMLAEYDVTPEQLASDLEEMIGQLEKYGLVSVEGGEE